MDAIGKSIQILLTILILSTAIERIATIIKLRFQPFFGRKATKGKKPISNELRDYRIFILNFFIGWIVLIILKAKFNAILSGNYTADLISSDDFQFNDFKKEIGGKISTVASIGITAFATSLGSKFWHDTLDIIFEIKNTRANLAALAKVEVDTLKDTNSALDNLKILNLQRTSSNVTPQIVSAFLAQNQTIAKDFDAVSLTQGYKKINGTETPFPALIFGLKEKLERDRVQKEKLIPAFYDFVYQNEAYKIPTDVKYSTTARASFARPKQPGNGFLTKCPGFGIARDTIENSTGTLGVVVKKKGDNKTRYLLSCYHVFFQQELPASIQIAKENEIVHHKAPGNFQKARFAIRMPSKEDSISRGQIVGYAIEGIFGQSMDAALAQIDEELLTSNGAKISSMIYGLNKEPKNIVKQEDVRIHSSLQLSGRTSGTKEGKIESVYAFQAIEYLGTELDFYNLIQVKRISDGGDSGAPVIDNAGNLVGLLIATNEEENFSYVLPMEAIADKLNVELI